jgi:xanthine dehydrogenase accessory factor
MSLFDLLKTYLAENQLCALATVIQAPAGVGAKLLVLPDGSAQGDIGEPQRSEIIQRAQALMRVESSEIIESGDARIFVEVYAPPPTLIIFGGVHTAVPLSLFAKTLGYRVVIVDGRAKFAERSRFPSADEVIYAWPQEAVPRLRFDSSTYVTVLTHDPKFDLPAIKMLVYTGARYIGAMGSKKTRQDHFEQLKADGVPEQLLRRVYGPIGLDLGAVTPEEMALAIMAEIVAVRYNRVGSPLSIQEGGSRAE